jgi:acetolactate synthase I/II/III large subunit
MSGLLGYRFCETPNSTGSKSPFQPIGVVLPGLRIPFPVRFQNRITLRRTTMADNDNRSEITAGGALFGKLKALGIDYVFANSGTDYPPIIEGLIEATQNGIDLPIPLTVPHEHVAIGMAHGYYQISGQIQSVMLHTNVGLSNAATGAINAWCDQIPMLLMSGRTPVMEGKRFGARTVPIGWGQEMFDQTALVREVTKWDYELRFPEQISDLFNRGWAIANSTPRGPVYISLPREILCEHIAPDGLDAPSRMAPVITAPEPEALRSAAEALAGAKNPLIISQRGTGSEEAFDALGEFLSDWAIPLSHYWANTLSVPLSHPMQVGASPEALLAEADVILVINSLAPWFPDKVTLRDDVKVIQLGPDPLFSRTPVRNFPADITLAGDLSNTLLALIDKMKGKSRNEDTLIKRRQHIGEVSAANRAAAIRQGERGNGSPMTKEWVSLCLGRAIKGRKATVFHELGCPLDQLDLESHNSYFQEPHSGGLGWGLPAALGAQLADRNRLVFATIGDGSYMFANPTACHQVAEALELPVITLVLNNEEWGAVRQSVEGLYKEGLARQANEVPMTSLRPSPDFTKTAEASRAYTETVTNGDDLPAALDRAIKVATEEKRQVLLNIAIERNTMV